MGEGEFGAYMRFEESKEPKEQPKSGEVERWRSNGERVLVDVESDEFRERLRELKEKSKEVNRALQQEMERRDLPFSTRRTHDTGMRFVVELRPEFFRTDRDDAQAQKNRETDRYTVQDDEVAAFLHMRSDGSLDMIPRFRSDLDGPRFEQFSGELFTRIERTGTRRERRPVDAELSQKLRIGDPKAIADLVADRLAATIDAHGFSEALQVYSLDDAQKFLDNALIFSLRDASIIRNLSRMALQSLLKSYVSQASEIPAGAKRFTYLDSKMRSVAEQFLDIPVNVMDETGKTHIVREYIAYNKGNNPDDVVRTIITDVLRQNKAQIYGWEQKHGSSS